ncbi:hypothetical protein E9232_006633 [Inquilinus ginsengisoli]|uniref:Uncharacterized protein n=1 Tax=Inquilinus ginsengisoli TaxID=363840 RepID=A0ABU1K2R4_9PROT|nr:DUF6236 family protein [Inquilinus ginsengisoli]MDR6294079.1 hypothetical protein [Inquilinus ginsengisoli]
MVSNNRGIIISNPITISEGHVRSSGAQLDPDYLQFCILFWDELIWPHNRNFSFISPNQTSLLEQEGILKRPEYTISGWVNEIIPKTYLAAFIDMDRREPGRWSLSSSASTIIGLSTSIIPNMGMEFSLYQALEIPSGSVPQNEVLEFKFKRKDELLSLRIYIDDILEYISKSGNPDRALLSKLGEIELKIKDHKKLMKEQTFPRMLTNIDIGINLAPTVGAAIGAAVGNHFGHPELGAVAGSSLIIGIKRSFGFARDDAAKFKPFEYVTSINKHLNMKAT